MGVMFSSFPRVRGGLGGERKGTFAVYLEPWHADIVEFWELRKIMERKSNVLESCFMLCGCLISLWKGLRVMDNGLYFAPTKHLVWQIVGEMNLRSFAISMKKKERQRKLPRYRTFGLQF
ncbi:hypothetical protein VNO77_19445 [Canavalia gladiata]|uniref:Ribonucleotide reductase large subunit C-terminal domain-containing protein n=1 Tax=Canavalia gladiata TaxID=3824 RepID=A0AAN9LSL0_CANGL